MINLMFWNVGRNAQSDRLGSAARDNDLDIIVLAESVEDGVQIVRSLNNDGPRRPYLEAPFAPPRGSIPSLRFFSRYDSKSIKPILDTGRVMIKTVTPPLGPEFLVVAAHLRSKAWADADDQRLAVEALRDQIANAERNVGHQRTMVIGDFNMDPFERGMLAADGLHAIMDKRIARRSRRIVQGEKYDFFYNPMWSRMGDDSTGPPGTYYFDRSGHVMNSYWNTFDQVLLRPALLPYYSASELKIVDRIGQGSLLDEGSIKREVSDHLPVVIGLAMERTNRE